MHELAEDGALAADLLRRMDARRRAAEPPPSTRLLWDRWRREATERLRTVRPHRGTTLGGLMRALEDPTLDHRRSPDFCTRHCRFLGRATARRCKRQPWSVVSLCAPDAWSEGCTLTLCFDADELEGLLRPAPDEGGSVPNPAVALAPDLAPLLRAELDADSAAALRWQIALARERRLGGRLAVSPGERDLLVGIVLPFLGSWVMSARPARLVVNLYRRWTPAFVQRALGRAGDALLFVLENPLLSTLSVLLAKVLRAYLCHVLTGGGTGGWVRRLHTAFRQELDQAIQNVPLLGALADLVFHVINCLNGAVVDAASGGGVRVRPPRGAAAVGDVPAGCAVPVRLRAVPGQPRGGQGAPRPRPPDGRSSCAGWPRRGRASRASSGCGATAWRTCSPSASAPRAWTRPSRPSSPRPRSPWASASRCGSSASAPRRSSWSASPRPWSVWPSGWSATSGVSWGP